MDHRWSAAAALVLALPTPAAGAPELLADLPLTAGDANIVHVYLPEVTSADAISTKVRDAEVLQTEVRRDGLVLLALSPEAGATEVVLKLKAGGAKGSYTLPVAPMPGSLSVEVEPGRLKPGRGGAVVRVVGTDTPADAQLSLVATAGSLQTLADTADGWLAPWTPPRQVAHPTPVLFVASDVSRPNAATAFGIIELSATERVSVTGPLQGEVSLSIGDRSFGTKQLGHRTSTSFEVTRFPSDAVAETTASSLDGAEDAQTLPLAQTGLAQVRLAPTLPSMAWPAGETVELRLAAVGPDGAPLTDPSGIQLNGPSNVAIAPLSDGLYALRFLAPNTEEPWSVSATLGTSMTFVGGRSVPGVPRSEVSYQSSRPGAAGGDEWIFVNARSAQGLTWDGELGVVGQGFTLVGERVLTPDGGWLYPVERSGSLPLIACAEPQLAPTGLPAVRVRVWSEQTALDAGQSTTVHAIAEDALGMPVPASVALRANRGSLSPITRTDGGHTLAQWSGNVRGPIRLEASLGDMTDTAALWVGAGARGAAPVGTEAEAGGEARWRAATPCTAPEP